jgi:hypothetical protein
LETVFRHAIKAAQVAAIRDCQSQIIDRPVVIVV